MQLALEIPDTLGQQLNQRGLGQKYIIKVLSETLTQEIPNRQWQDWLVSLETLAKTEGAMELTPRPHSRVEDLFGLCKPAISVSLAQMEEAIAEGALE